MAEQMTDMGVVVRTAGGPEALEWTSLDTAKPGRGEVRIEQRAMVLQKAATDDLSLIRNLASTAIRRGRGDREPRDRRRESAIGLIPDRQSVADLGVSAIGQSTVPLKPCTAVPALLVMQA